MNFISKKPVPFWLITIAVLTGLCLPVLIQDGMFMDALLYTSVSHNLSQGIGTFWFPQFSYHNVAAMASFHEQPPLVFGIQSLFFSVFGSSMYVERFYTLVTLIVTAILIVLLWKEIFRENEIVKKYGWLPVLLWITIPVCFWSYSNNIHENTMGIFTFLSVYFVLRAYSRGKNTLLLIILAGISVFLATFSKGIPGLFPVTVPFLYWLFIRKHGFLKAVFHSAIIVFIPAIIYGILILFPEPRESLSLHFIERALQRINEVPTVDYRAYILVRLLMELAGQIVFVLIFLFIFRFRKSETKGNVQWNYALFFISAGIAGSLPLMLTMVQKGFYFVPSLPFFAIGLSIIAIPALSELIERINVRKTYYSILLISGIVLMTLALSLTVFNAGKASRDREMIHDVHLIGKVVPAKSIVSIPYEIWNEWSLQCYLIRHYNISMDMNSDMEFYLIDKSMPFKKDSIYGKLDIGLEKYDLYRLRDQQ